jgi:ABC-type phosphonate transport system ATPase subunit
MREKAMLTEGATLSGAERRYRMRTHSGESHQGAEGVRTKVPISQAKGQRTSKVFS